MNGLALPATIASLLPALPVVLVRLERSAQRLRMCFGLLANIRPGRESDHLCRPLGEDTVPNNGHGTVLYSRDQKGARFSLP